MIDALNICLSLPEGHNCNDNEILSTEIGKLGLQVTNNPLSLSQSAGFPAMADNLFSCSTIKQDQVLY
jgi:hypothetical protein